MTQKHFEDVAAVYDDVFKPHILDHYARRRLDLFTSVCPPGGRVLDYGCGTGWLGARLMARGFDVFGTEYSANMFKKATERGLKGALVQDVRIPFAESSFDLVYCVAVFHHLETTDNVRRAIHEMVRVTKPGGALVVWDHNPRNPFWPMLMRRWPQDHGDERLVPLAEIVQGMKAEPTGHLQSWRSGWMPEFVPAFAMPAMRLVERILESLPIVRSYSAHNIVCARRL